MPPLMLFPPFPFDARVLAPLDEALGGRLLPTPEPSWDTDPTLDRIADTAVADLDARGIDRAVVGGVSMGGYVALTLLRRHPGRVTGLVLIDTRAAADTDEARANRLAMADRADHGELPDPVATVTGMVSPATREHRPEIVDRLAGFVAGQSAASIAWRQRAMAARPDTTAALAAAGVPVLVVVGADDALTPPGLAAAMAAGTRQSTLREIPDAGHLAVAEDPAAVAAVITDWEGRTWASRGTRG